ncbi:serine hydrolase domain-containing protein [Microbispora sp. GKU 823]|uniref:serine hydrolase domain-containing protein n=1 Tax=Microbispora sp. GKU 823 TaxID=1652100 RepID=UPI001C4DF1D5|nr:serine hydrolase domain-containing protein [Microbispora sp. GKU 823]
MKPFARPSHAGSTTTGGAAQLAVYQDGRLVVDLWAGGDPIGGRPVSGDSLGIVMSVSKGAVATCAHLLSQRGVLDLDAPVAHYWPEFSAGGKARIRVSDLLTHRAGLSGFNPFAPEAPIGPDAYLDWGACVAALEAMSPLWEPGTAMMYHALTYGYLVGEVIRRATGRTVGAVLADLVAGPLGLDLWIGLPESEEHRFVPQFSRSLSRASRRCSRCSPVWASIRPTGSCAPPPRPSAASPRRRRGSIGARPMSPRSLPPTASRTPVRSPACTPRRSARSTGFACSTATVRHGRVPRRPTTCPPRRPSTACRPGVLALRARLRVAPAGPSDARGGVVRSRRSRGTPGLRAAAHRYGRRLRVHRHELEPRRRPRSTLGAVDPGAAGHRGRDVLKGCQRSRRR